MSDFDILNEAFAEGDQAETQTQEQVAEQEQQTQPEDTGGSEETTAQQDTATKAEGETEEVYTPTADKPSDESDTFTPTETSGKQEKQEQTPAVEENQVLDYLKQQGLEIDSLGQLKEKLSFEPQSLYASADAQAFNEWQQKTGGSLDDYVNIQRIDFDQLSDTDAIRQNILRTDPLASQDKDYLNQALKRFDTSRQEAKVSNLKAKIESGDLSDDEIAQAQEQIEDLQDQITNTEYLRKAEGQKAKAELNGLKEQINKPQQSKQEVDPAVIEQHNKTIDGFAKYKAVTIPDEGANLKVQLSDEERSGIAERMRNLGPLSKEQYGEVYMNLVKMIKWNDIVKGFKETFSNSGKADLIKSEKNIQIKPEGSQAQSIMSNEDKALDALSGLLNF